MPARGYYEDFTPEERAEIQEHSRRWRADHPASYWIATIVTVALVLGLGIGAVLLQWIYNFPLH